MSRIGSGLKNSKDGRKQMGSSYNGMQYANASRVLYNSLLLNKLVLRVGIGREIAKFVYGIKLVRVLTAKMNCEKHQDLFILDE